MFVVTTGTITIEVADVVAISRERPLIIANYERGAVIGSPKHNNIQCCKETISAPPAQ